MAHPVILYLNHDIAFPSPALAKAAATGRCTTSVLCDLITPERKPTSPLFIVSNSRLRPSRTAHQKEESMRPLNNPTLGDFRAS